MEIDDFWNRFLKTNAVNKNTKYVSSFHFELTEKWANELLRLVLIGKKCATSSALEEFRINKERVPQKGDLNIITDWNGHPKCIIETTNVLLIPYKDMTFDICKSEGEDDSLESWQEGHRRYFEEEGKELGYQFNDSLIVVFEDFHVIYKE